MNQPDTDSQTTEMQPARPATRWLALMLIGVILAAPGCVYRFNIQQGNYLDQETVDRVEVGMTRSQVRFILGTPMVEDAFHDDRWDYIYYLDYGRGNRKTDKRHFVVFFDGNAVRSVERRDTT